MSRGVVHCDTLGTISLALGPTCPAGDCPFDDDHVWTGLAAQGLTHSRLPLPGHVLELREVCFYSPTRQQICPPIDQLDVKTIKVEYPDAPKSGETLRFAVTAAQATPYQLREDRSDFLSSTDASDDALYGAWSVIPVKGIVESGQVFTFTDYDNPFVVPAPPAGRATATFTSTWRWANSRGENARPRPT